MKKSLIKYRLFIFFLCLGISGIAQKNIFLSRNYWKNNPSLDQVKNDIAQGNNPTELDSNAFDSVTWALIEKVNNETIKFLLEYKENGVNKLTHDGRTYIFWAAYKDNLEMLQYLVDNGAKTNIIDHHGYSILNFAAVTGQQNHILYDFLISHGADITETNRNGANPLLLVSPFLKDDKLINYFTNKGIDFNSKDDDGNGIFNYAVKKGNIQVLDLLIKKGADYKTPSKNGSNAFIFASQGTRGSSNKLLTYKYLENLGLQPNITTDDGFTPLHALAYNNKDINIFKYFIEKGLDINQSDMNGNTAFLNAAHKNNIEIITFLSNYVNDINEINKNGQTALMGAVETNTLEVINFLINKKSNISIKDNDNNTLVYYLIESYDEKDPNIFNKKLKKLLNKGLKINKNQSKGQTLWHLAVKKNNLQLLEQISSFNNFLNQKNEEGLTPIHLAAMKATDTEILKFLMEKGADITIKTDYDESVFDLAYENELLQKQNKNLNFLK